MNAAEKEKLQKKILEIIGDFDWEEDKELFIKTKSLRNNDFQ